MKAIIATDGSPSALDAARGALGLFRDDMEFLLVVVVPEPFDPMETAGGFEGPIMDAEEAAKWAAENDQDGREALRRTVDVLEEKVSVKMVHDDAPGEALCDLARDQGADVLVVGASEKGVLRRLLEGSVMRYVTKRAPCPVLIVRHDDADEHHDHRTWS